MATQRQKKLAKAIVDNTTRDKPLNKKELLVSSGYSVISAEASASPIMEQKGVQEELEILGFTEANAKQVVQDIMLDEHADRPSRLKAADMVFKVQGTYAPEKHELKGELTTDTEAERAAAIAYAESIRASHSQ